MHSICHERQKAHMRPPMQETRRVRAIMVHVRRLTCFRRKLLGNSWRLRHYCDTSTPISSPPSLLLFLYTSIEFCRSNRSCFIDCKYSLKVYWPSLWRCRLSSEKVAFCSPNWWLPSNVSFLAECETSKSCWPFPLGVRIYFRIECCFIKDLLDSAPLKLFCRLKRSWEVLFSF